MSRAAFGAASSSGDFPLPRAGHGSGLFRREVGIGLSERRIKEEEEISKPLKRGAWKICPLGSPAPRRAELSRALPACLPPQGTPGRAAGAPGAAGSEEKIKYNKKIKTCAGSALHTTSTLHEKGEADTVITFQSLETP